MSDNPQRLLRLATWGTPPRRREWADAMVAELATIEDPAERRVFARGVAAAALGTSWGARGVLCVGAALVSGASVVVASRLQFEDGQPGVLGAVVLLPAIALFLVALVSGWKARSFAAGVATGFAAWFASFVAVSSVLAIEGVAWMTRHGVFVLDGDAPKRPVTTLDVAVDFFATGLFVAPIVWWALWVVVGAAVGSLVLAGIGSHRGRGAVLPA